MIDEKGVPEDGQLMFQRAYDFPLEDAFRSHSLLVFCLLVELWEYHFSIITTILRFVIS
jgi:hypothetical protein